jgi:hypothetical protein
MDRDEDASRRAREEISALFGEVQGHTATNYVKRGAWYLAAERLYTPGTLPRLARPEIPGFGPKVYWGLLLNRITGHRVRLPLNNTVVQIAENGKRIRAFEPELGLTRKLVSRDSKYGRGIATDLSVRQGTLTEAGVRHPALRTTREVAGHVFFEEELIRGRRFRPQVDGRLTATHLVEPLSRLHATVGLRTFALTEALGNATVDRLLALDIDTGIVRRVHALIDRNPRVTVAFGHGDLLQSNLAVDRTGVVFLDCETAGYALVGFDLLRLWRKYPRVKPLARGAATLIRRHQSGPLSFYDTACLQLAIGLLGARKPLDGNMLRHLPKTA